jgi:threonine dehydrogenase-like Zn-dependent dehydrogenase
MRALVLDYAGRRLETREIPEPPPPGPGQALLRVAETGVCGTDRELASFRFGFPPAGEPYLVLGHEALAQVVETGGGVTSLKPGDWVVPMVRRACSPPCASCARGRRDLCVSGGYRERGIFGAHGYFAAFVVDDACDLVRVPAALVDFAVLLEPLSVAEKAAATALRLHAGEPRSALVFGAGAVGLLAALTLQLRGLEVSMYSLEPAGHPRAALASGAAAGRYRDRSRGRAGSRARRSPRPRPAGGVRDSRRPGDAARARPVRVDRGQPRHRGKRKRGAAGL